MRKIINGLLYDTDKSKKIMETVLYSIYRTSHGRLFMTNTPKGIF